MNDREKSDLGTAILEMKESLDAAVYRAGGSPFISCNLIRLKGMSAFDLICSLAPNGIRFIYEGDQISAPLLKKEQQK